MKLKKIVNERLNEIYFHMKHPSGLNIYLYPKKWYKSYYAVLGVNYGSIDTKFQLKEKGIIKVPDGIAHYLEHKLFEGKDANAFELYAKTGASANAYTSFDKTAYLFSCSDNFDSSLGILLDFVQSPYFTEENVEKERGIIAQEIKMYEDSPDWRVFFNLLNSLYNNHSVKSDIAGTIESIGQITSESLYECYNAFYNLNNMSLCISGNIDIDSTLDIIDKHLKYSQPFTTQRIIHNEPIDVAQGFTSQNFEISLPMFQFGFKEKVDNNRISAEQLAYTDIILRALGSKASPMYNKLLDSKLINTASFAYEYFEVPGAASVVFAGESKDPEETAKIICEEAEKLRNSGINEETFEWAKRSVYGENVATFNSIDAVSNILLDFSFSGREFFNYIDSISSATLNNVNYRLRQQLDPKYSSLSVVKPYGE